MGHITSSKFFPLGRITATKRIADFLTKEELHHCLARHTRCDWGDICEESWELNDAAVSRGARLLSVYMIRGQKIWVITEHDRSATTILFPEEY